MNLGLSQPEERSCSVVWWESTIVILHLLFVHSHKKIHYIIPSYLNESIIIHNNFKGVWSVVDFAVFD